jgi:hypothetical protein
MCNPVRRRRQIEETLRHKQPTNTLPHTHTHTRVQSQSWGSPHAYTLFLGNWNPQRFGFNMLSAAPPPLSLSLCDEGECMQSVCVCALRSIYMPENATGESNVTYRAGKTWNYLWCVCLSLSVCEGGMDGGRHQTSSPRINSHICLLHFRCGHHLFSAACPLGDASGSRGNFFVLPY